MNIMSAFKRGQEKGLGKFTRDDDVRIRPAKEEDTRAKGKDLSKEVFGNNDNPAVRGTREGFS
jgi:hypothetical protein